MISSTVQNIIDSFESSFKDKVIVPEALELLWLKKAIGRYSVELDPLTFDESTGEFNPAINQYTIDTLAAFMKQYYQEREVSRVNKQVSIVGKDLSVDGNGNGKVAARNELEYCDAKSIIMVSNQKPTAYS